MPATLNTPEQADTPAANQRKLKICHLSMGLNTGGLERLLVDFARFHAGDHFDLSFVALEGLGQPADDLREAGYEVQSVELPKVGKWGAIKKLKDFLIRNQIDILHTHNTYPYFYGSLAAKWAGTKHVINSQHGRGCGPGWKSLWQFRIANGLSDRVVGVSEDATKLCQDQDRSHANKMACIWNGIDLDRFRYYGPRQELIAISVARLSPEKDFATLLKAVRKVVDLHPQFRLRMIGDGQERGALEKLTNELKLSSNVTFLGERKDVPELLRTAGFFVSSSKTEGISLTLLEAMAVGLPIVTTRVGGNPEIVIPGETGYLVPPQNPDALATSILDMIEAKPLWPDMAQAARKRVEEHFNIRVMVSNYEKLYRELTEK